MSTHKTRRVESTTQTGTDTNDSGITVRFVTTSEHPAETFEEPNLRKHVLEHMEGRVLNVCCGPTRLSEWYDDGEIIRNDLNPDIESDYSVDIAELPCYFEQESFDTIVFDPPWSAYQSNLRYDGFNVGKEVTVGELKTRVNVDIRELPFKTPGENAVYECDQNVQVTLTDSVTQNPVTIEKQSEETAFDKKHRAYIDADSRKTQIGHARLAKIGFDYLLKDGGKVIQYAYTGGIMASDLGYERVNRVAFDPTGEGKTLIGGVDKKTE